MHQVGCHIQPWRLCWPFSIWRVTHRFSVYTVLATAFVTLGCVTGPTNQLPKRAAQAVSRIILTVALMIALSAGQLVSSLRLLPEMGRYSGIEYSAATRYSFQARDLLATFSREPCRSFPRISRGDWRHPVGKRSATWVWPCRCSRRSVSCGVVAAT